MLRSTINSDDGDNSHIPQEQENTTETPDQSENVVQVRLNPQMLFNNTYMFIQHVKQMFLTTKLLIRILSGSSNSTQYTKLHG